LPHSARSDTPTPVPEPETAGTSQQREEDIQQENGLDEVGRPDVAADDLSAPHDEVAEPDKVPAEAREATLAQAREEALAEIREKELAVAREKALAELHSAQELVAAQERALAEAREKELAEARRAREVAEARENRLIESRENELAASRRAQREAEARDKLRESQESALVQARAARYRAYRRGGMALAFGLAVLAVVSQVLGQDLDFSYRGRLLATIGLATAAFLCFFGATLLPRFLEARRMEREVEKRAREAAHEAVEELADAADLAALIRANRKQMEAYDVLARAQAKTAFRNSQVAMGAGLLVLFLGAILAIGADDTASKITTASLTAIGGTLSGFIAQTFLRTYSRALRQLNFYFQQPLINSYLLGAQRLINEMSEDKRDPALSDVIAHVMAVVVRLPWSGAELERGSDTTGPAKPLKSPPVREPEPA
jgi:hypothetical protein